MKTMSIILAGDIGGTKTLLGLFDPVPARPRAIAVRAFSTTEHADLPALVTAFTTRESVGGSIEAACFGVAGPVVADTATLTNVPWHIDARAVAKAFGIAHVALLND